MQIRLWVSAVVIASALGLAHLLGLFTPLDNQLLDLRFKMRGSPDLHPELALVVIGDEDFREYGPWPLPNLLMSQFVKTMDTIGVRALVLDAIFSRPTAGKGDMIFRNAVRESDKVHFPLRFSQYSEAISLEDSSVSPRIIKQSIEQFEPGPYVLPMQGLQVLLLPGLDTVARSLGFVHVMPDEDGIVRRTPLLMSSNGMVFPHLALQVWGRTTRVDFKKLSIRGGMLALGHREIISLDGTGQMLVNWPGKWKDIPKWSFGKILRSHRAILAGKTPEISKDSLELLKGKIVLVGPVDRTSYEFVSTPLENQHPVLGLDFAILNTIFKHNEIRTASYQIVILLLFLLGLITAFILRQKEGLLAMVAVGAVIVFLSLSQLLFIYLDVDLPITALVLNALILGFWHNFNTNRSDRLEKQKAKTMLARYMTPELAFELMEDQEWSSGSGKNRTVTVLFSDIRGFTAISESKDPRVVVDQLNEYLEIMYEVATRFDGQIDKFVGDGIMVYFGVFKSQDMHAMRAVRCAFEMQKALSVLNDRWEANGKERFDIGIGINTGTVIVGDVGTSDFSDFTVIGDSVNLASRLCAVANPTEVLISPATYQDVFKKINVTNSREVMVKGKKYPVRVYAITEILSKEAKEKRQFERINISLEIQLERKTGLKESAWLVDLSAGGFCCVAKQEWINNELIEITIRLPNGIEVRADSRIVDATLVEEGVRIKAEFVAIEETQGEEIVKYAQMYSDDGAIA